MKTYTLVTAKEEATPTNKPFDLSKMMMCIRDKKVYVRQKGVNTAFRNIHNGINIIYVAEFGPDKPKPDDKIYMFDNDTQIVESLESGQWLCNYRYEPKKQLENTLTETQLKALINGGKYIGMNRDCQFGKRHITLTAATNPELQEYKSVKDNGQFASSSVFINFNYLIREYDGKVFVFENQYEFFKWLNAA